LSEPNYPGYTLDELYDARDHVDRGSYPGRYRQILEEIERRGSGAGESANAKATARPVFPLARVTLGLLVLALASEYPGQQIEVSIETEDAGHRVVVVMIGSKYARSSQRRKEKAREIAGVALTSHPRRDEVVELVVIYRGAVGSTAANLATDRRYSYAPDELDVEPATAEP
jgi:hypothetical protein